MDTIIKKITQTDGYTTDLFCYETTKDTVLGNIVIFHGMAEHHERYLNFINALTNEGFDVYIYSHRGHGTDKKLEELGYIAKKNGASRLVSDAHAVCTYVKKNGRSKKLAVMGHSMGSMVLRCLMQIYDEMDCAIVCSSTMPPVAMSKFGILLANIICAFRGADKQSNLLNQAMFGGKAYTSLCTHTDFDWLTRNKTIVEEYINDPYCGFLCTASFYRDLATLAARSAQKKGIAKTRKNLPVLFLAGTKDPVGGYGTQISQLHQRFVSLGFEQTQLKLYPEARHELLNEINFDEVYTDIITYLHNNLA